MHNRFSRRSFVGASMAATAAAALVAKPAALVDLIATPDAEGRVFAMLQQHLGLLPSDRAVSDAFVQRLRSDGAQHKLRPSFGARLNSTQAEGESLEVYILQAFVLATNYASCAGGLGDRLELTTSHHQLLV